MSRQNYLKGFNPEKNLANNQSEYNKAVVTLSPYQVNPRLFKSIEKFITTDLGSSYIGNELVSDLLTNNSIRVNIEDAESINLSFLGRNFTLDMSDAQLFESLFNFINSKNIDKSSTKPKIKRKVIEIFSKEIAEFTKYMNDRWGERSFTDHELTQIEHNAYEYGVDHLWDSKSNIKDVIERMMFNSLINEEEEDTLQGLLIDNPDELKQALSENFNIYNSNDYVSDDYIYYDDYYYSGDIINPYIDEEQGDYLRETYKIDKWVNDPEANIEKMLRNTYLYGYEDEFKAFITKKSSEFEITENYEYLKVYINVSNLRSSLSEYLVSNKKKLKSLLGGNGDKDLKAREKKITRIKNNILYRIASILISVVKDVNVKIPIKDIKKEANNNNMLGQLFTKKDGQNLLQAYTSGFSIADIINYDAKLPSIYTPNSFLSYIESNGDLNDWVNIDITSKTWTSSIQKIFKETNYVMQFNIKPDKLDEFLNLIEDTFGSDMGNSNILRNYIKSSNHPTSKKTLSLGWIRYTIEPEYNGKKIKGVVLDEIQTDLAKLIQTKEKKEYEEYKRELREFDDKDITEDMKVRLKNLSQASKNSTSTFLDKWEDFFMRKFISYAKKNLGYNKIYMPTYQTKLDVYNASPPASLYKELPNRFSFKKDSDVEGFMLLEKKLEVYKRLV
jgi:hypothetical protein